MQTLRVRPFLLSMAILAVPVVLTLSPEALLGAAPSGDSPRAKLHKAVAEEKYAEAKRQADALLRSPNQQDRVAASLCYGRILLSLGLKDQARQYLATMGRLNLDANAAGQMEVYKAWLAALDGKPDEAIKTLEKMLVDKRPGSATAEAADVLAMLYLKRGDKAAAKRAVNFGLGFIKYEKLKHGYIEKLLKGRLKVDTGDAFPEAKKLYVQAEKLRKEGKFTEAGKLYVRVRSGWPRSLWSHAAGFRIGQCLLGLGRLPQAEGHWQAFATDSPPGPWRGQVRVGLIDLVLASRLDLKTAARHAAAAQKILETGVDEAAKPSWDAASMDIHLRQGIVGLVDGSGETAAVAFRQAKQAALARKEKRSDRLLAGLDRLVEAAEKNLGVIPDELTIGGDEKLPLALSLGTIYNLVGRFEQASAMFDLVLGGSARKSFKPHRSFAALGKARALVGEAKKGTVPLPEKPNPTAAASGGLSPFSPAAVSMLNAAKALYSLSLNEKPDAAWHQETLRELALLIEELAEQKAATLTAAQAKADPKKKQRVLSRDQLRAALEGARSEALPHWVKLITQFPKNPHLPEALYHAGVLFSEGAKPDAEKSVAAFERLVKEFPKSPYAGGAYVRLIDNALERKFDLKLATALADRGIQWAQEQKVEVTTTADGTLTRKSLEDAAKAIQDASAALPACAQFGGKSAASLLDDLYNLYLRAGIVAYLQGEYEEATQYLNAAGPARPTDGMQARFDLQKIGLHILKNSCKRQQPAWYADAVSAAKTDSQKLALKLADTYLHAQRPNKAEAIYGKLLGADPSLGRPTKAVEGYCLMQLALAYSNQKVNYDRSVEYYKRFYQKDYAGLPWAADAIMRLAVLEYNATQDPRRSIGHYRYVLSKYPNHRDAERALYFLALDAVQVGDKSLAESSCKEFLRRYPHSGWRNHIQTVLKDEVPKVQDRSKGSVKE